MFFTKKDNNKNELFYKINQLFLRKPTTPCLISEMNYTLDDTLEWLQKAYDEFLNQPKTYTEKAHALLGVICNAINKQIRTELDNIAFRYSGNSCNKVFAYFYTTWIFDKESNSIIVLYHNIKIAEITYNETYRVFTIYYGKLEYEKDYGANKHKYIRLSPLIIGNDIKFSYDKQYCNDIDLIDHYSHAILCDIGSIIKCAAKDELEYEDSNELTIDD